MNISIAKRHHCIMLPTGNDQKTGMATRKSTAIERKKSLPRFFKSLVRSRSRSDATTSTAASDISEDYFESDTTLVATAEAAAATTTTATKPKKTVSFAPSAKLRFTLPRSSYTDEEKAAAFFCKEEYTHIKKTCSKTVEKMEQGIDLSSSLKYCPRGLESYTKTAASLRLQNRLAAYNVVLDGQDMLNSDEQISQDYQSVSSCCRLWANTVGLRDQKSAL